jgi:hypothetical protein
VECARTGVMNGMPLSEITPKPLFCAEKIVHENSSEVRSLFNVRCVCAGNPGCQWGSPSCVFTENWPMQTCR